jgi:hypothetical protein
MSRFKVNEEVVWSSERVRVKAAADGPRCLVQGEGWAMPMWVTDDTLRHPNQEPRYAEGGVIKGTGGILSAAIDNGYVIPAAVAKKAGLEALRAFADKTEGDKPLVNYPTHDAVNHPKHYISHPSGIECIQITEVMGFCLGNALKYIWRADLKNDANEDFRKAIWYIERELSLRERKEKQPAKEN